MDRRKYNLIQATLIVVFILMVIGIALVSANFGYSAEASTGTTRYVSVWTRVYQGQTVKFYHGIGERPLIVNVWVAHFVSDEESGKNLPPPDFNDAIPYNQTGVVIDNVNSDFISIYNGDSNGARYVQILAEK